MVFASEPMLNARDLVGRGLAAQEADEGSIVHVSGVVHRACSFAVTREYAPRLPDPYCELAQL